MDKKQGQGHSRMTPKQKVAKKRRNIIIFIVELFVLAIVVVAAWVVIRVTGTDHTNLDAGVITDPAAELDSDKIYVNPDAGVNVSQNGDIEIDPNNPIEKLNDVFFAILGGNGRMVNGVIHVTNEERKIQKEFVIEKIADFLLEMIG